MSTYQSLLARPARSLQDCRIRQLEQTIAQLKQYHPAKRAKRNKVKRILWDYESLLESFQFKLG